MKTNLSRSIVGVLFIALTASVSSGVPATKAKSPPPATSAVEPAAKDKTTKFPFHGKLSAVDVGAKTFTLEGKTPRVFHVIEQTKIMKNGQVATLPDAKAGEDVGGYTEKAADGTLTALSVRFGPKPEKEGAAPAPAEAATPAAEPATPKPKAKRGKKADTPAPAAATPAAGQ